VPFFARFVRELEPPFFCLGASLTNILSGFLGLSN
jgi:hypothetical protein